MLTFKLAAVGECMVELSGQPFVNLSQSFGGDTLNTCAYIKKISPNSGVVSYVTAMGRDPLSAALIDQWQALNIDTSSVLLDEAHHVGMYFIENDRCGERFFYYWRDNSAARYLFQHPQIDEVFAGLTEYDAIFLSGISLAILSKPDRQLFFQHLRRLKRSGVSVIFDGNYRPRLWDSVESAQDAASTMYELSDLLLLTYDDEAALWSDRDIDACFARLQPFSVSTLVLKDGPNGCFYLHAGERGHVGTDYVKSVVDTTSAGDSFNAGFLVAWLAGQALSECAALGNCIAGQVIQQKGAIVDIDVPNLSFLNKCPSSGI